MMKNLLYTLAVILLIAACYYGYDWYISEPDDKEPLPALLSIISSTITLIIAWKMESSGKDIDVSRVKGLVDIDEKTGKTTTMSIKNIKKDGTVLINKGKNSLKKYTDNNSQ